MYGVFAGESPSAAPDCTGAPGRTRWRSGIGSTSTTSGSGYATELSAALTDLAFTVDGIELVEIHHDAANVRSAAVPAKLGYEHVATGAANRSRRRTRASSGRGGWTAATWLARPARECAHGRGASRIAPRRGVRKG